MKNQPRLIYYCRSNLKVRFFILLLGLSCFCSCSNSVRSATTADLITHLDITSKLHNLKLQTWNFKGKMQVTFKQNNQTKVIMAQLCWQKLPEYSIVKLNTPFNLGGITLKILDKNHFNDDEILILNSNITHSSIEKNLIKNFKLLHHLNYWLLGLPNPNLTYTKTDNELLQDNWIIKYSNYKEVELKRQLVLIPHTLNLNYTNTKTNYELKLKIITTYVRL